MAYLERVSVSFIILQTLALMYGFNVLGLGALGEPEDRSGDVTTSTCTEPSEESEAEFNDQMLEWQNFIRCMHNAPALELNDDLIAEAQIWAQHLANTHTFIHDNTACLGENLALTSDTSLSNVYTVVRDQWYCDEYDSFNFDDPDFNSDAGHLTAVLWKSTTQLGCGVQSGTYNFGGTDYDVLYVVCRYSPPGNSPCTTAFNIEGYIPGYNYCI